MNGRGTKKSLTFRFRYDYQDEYCADIRKGCAAVVWEARVVVPADPADRVVCNMEETMIQLKGIRKSFYEGTAKRAKSVKAQRPENRKISSAMVL